MNFHLSTLWADAAAVTRWAHHDFHREVLVLGLRGWCVEGCFGEYELAADHARARKCPGCGRWSQARPGWDERGPAACTRCDEALSIPAPIELAASPGA